MVHCKCGSRTLSDAHGEGACWRCYMELLKGKNALVKENEKLRAEVAQLEAELTAIEASV